MNCLVMLMSLGSGDFVLNETIECVIQDINDDTGELLIMWDEANLGWTGTDRIELIKKFQNMILHLREQLEKIDDSDLEAGPLRTKRVLMRVIGRK